jgi:FkbM family methyltransferase
MTRQSFVREVAAVARTYARKARHLDRRWRAVQMVCGVELCATRSSPGWARAARFGWYELETDLFLRGMLRPGTTAIDVGANEGVLTVLAGTLVGPSGKIVAFEPDPSSRSILQKALRRNDLGNVRVEPVAAGATSGTVTFAEVREASYAKVAGEGRSITCVTLDHYCQQEGIDALHLLKVDVDGPELHVLEGAQGLLSRASRKPFVIVELSRETDRLGYHWTDILTFLQGLGYATYGSRMKFARVLEVEHPTDFKRLPVDFDRGDVANLFCTPRRLSYAELDAIWPRRFVPQAYFDHYFGSSPFNSPGEFWDRYQDELLRTPASQSPGLS